MSEMAKYLKKRRISLHDIIFKNRKGSQEETKKDPLNERVVVQVVTERGAVGNAPRLEKSQPKCSSPKSERRYIQVCTSAPDNEPVVDRANLDVSTVVGDRMHGIGIQDLGRMKTSRRIDSGSGENSSGSDTSERYQCKSDSDSSDENYIMNRYFKSMTLSDDEKQPPSTRLGLPTIETGSSRSLSAIPWSEMKKDAPLSRSCYEICSNRTPGTSCGSSCSTSFTRPKQGKSLVTYWPNTGSESDLIDIIPLSSSKVTRTKTNMNRPSKRETLSPLNLVQLESTQHSASLKSVKREPSSLHVSPNRSPYMSCDPTLSPSSVMSAETLPPAFSPFAACPVINHRSLRPSYDLNLHPLRPSSSNPTINQAFDFHQHTFPSRLLSPVQLSPLSRSNPNLYVNSPPGDHSSSSVSPSSASGYSPSTSPRRLSPLPIPIPPSSPRPAWRCRRSPRVKQAGAEFQQNFDNF